MDSHKASKAMLELVRELEQLSEEALIRQGPSLHSDEKLLGSLMEFLISDQSSEDQALLERFYQALLRCYRTFDEHLLKFVNQFMFCLIWRHFHDTVKSRQYGITIRPALDALLISIYNVMIADSEGHQKARSYTVASLSNPSIYHDPAEFTENILKGNAGGRDRGANDQERRILMGNYPSAESLTRSKKWIVFRVLLRGVADDLAYYSRACQKSAIKMGRLLIPLSDTNFARSDVDLKVKKEPRPFDKLKVKNFSMGKDKSRTADLVQTRTVLDERFLVDILDIYYMLAYQGLYEESLGLINDILDEGEHRILASVVLLAGSIRNRLESAKQDVDELEEMPVLGTAATEEEQPRTRKVSAHSNPGGSVRDKFRRQSFISKKEKETSSSPRGDTVKEVSEVDNSDSVRATTPNESAGDVGDGYQRMVEMCETTKISPRNSNSIPVMNRSSETVV